MTSLTPLDNPADFSAPAPHFAETGADFFVAFAGRIQHIGCRCKVPEDVLSRLIQGVLTLLTALGVIVDPTTQGIGDSARAMGYDQPYPAG